jgi:hypothetical protein
MHLFDHNHPTRFAPLKSGMTVKIRKCSDEILIQPWICPHYQKTAVLSLVSGLIIFVLCCQGVIAVDPTGNTLPGTTALYKGTQESGFERPGMFLPVIPKDGTKQFSFVTENSENIFLTGGDVAIQLRPDKNPGESCDVIILRFKGQDSQVVPRGENPYLGRMNFFIGNNSSAWQTEVPLYRSVLYEGIYSGIDLTYAERGGRLKSEFLVAPAADPHLISYTYEGSKPLRIDETGAIVIQSEQGGLLLEGPPSAMQVIANTTIKIPVKYQITQDNQVGFRVSTYNEDYPLIIDPEIITSTYLGGEVEDAGKAITVDDKGSIYVTGYTHSTDFPVTQGTYTPSSLGYHDIFLTVFEKNGTEILYSLLIGGVANDYARTIAVGSDGMVYIAGSTESDDFPTRSAFQSSKSGKYDAFITAIRPGGKELAFSSYLGGNDIDDAFGVFVGGPKNQISLTGTTLSQDFPVKNAFQRTNAGQYDVFVTIFDTSGKEMIASTFLGGRQDDYGRAVTLDKEGNLYLGGYTYSSKSSDFPVKNALQGPHTMTYDAFVSKLSPDAQALVYSTYIGGTMGDRISAIALDQKNQLYATGYTFADDFPTTRDAFQRTYGGDLLSDAFIVGLSADGRSLVASTYLGGSKDDMGYGITIDEEGLIYITGGTMSSDFPLFNAWQKNLSGSMNAFVSGVDPSCSHLIFSSYLGGEGSDLGASIMHDNNNLLYITGTTGSAQFPVVHPNKENYRGDDDAFLAIISPDGSRVQGKSTPEIPSSNPASFSPDILILSIIFVFFIKYYKKY